MNSAPTWEETQPVVNSPVPTWESTEPAGDGGYWSDVRKNAVEGIKEFPHAIYGMAKTGADIFNAGTPFGPLMSEIQMAQGVPYSDTTQAQGTRSAINLFKNAPGAVLDAVKDVGHTIAHPVDTFREKPIGTALNVASVAIPAIRGARKLFAAPALEAAGEAAAPSLFQKGAAKVTSAMFGPKSDDILSRMKNPDAINNALPLTDVSDNLVTATSDLHSQIEKASEVARSTLRKGYEGDTPYNKGQGAVGKLFPRKSGAVSANNVESVISKTKNALGVYGGGLVGTADKKAVQILEGIQNDINAVGKNVRGKMQSIMGVDSIVPKNANLPESTVGDIIRKLDANINWADESATTANTALERVRTELDSILKNQNPDYKKAMIPVDEKMRLMGDVKRQFNVSSAAGEGWKAGTATEGKLSNLLGPNKSKIADTLERLKAHTGVDIHDQVKNFKTSQAFVGGSPNGARRVAFGTAIGTGVGKIVGNPALGAITGSTLGLMADSYGGEMARKIADVLGSPQFSKYSSVLEDSAKQGAKNLVATNAALIKSDPEYADAIGGNVLSKDEARIYLRRAGGDRQKARELAISEKRSYR